MKKQFLSIVVIFIVIITVLGLYMYNYQKQQLLAEKNNQFYEKYTKGKILGTDLITLINKVMDANDRNAISKNGKYYEDDNEKTIKIYIKFLETEEDIYMEDIAEKTSETFIKFFALEQFECVKKEYHSKTGNLKSMIFQQI